MAHSRQTRLSDPDKISQRIQEFSGRPVQLVLHGSKVLHGEISRVDGSVVTIRNFRGRNTEVSLKEIRELFFDTLDLC